MSDYINKLVKYTAITNEYGTMLLEPKNSNRVEVLKTELRNKLNELDPDMRIIGSVPFSIEKLVGYMPSIGDLVSSNSNVDPVVIKKVIKTYIINLAYKYLSTNQKSRSLTEATAVNLLTEYIVDECSNLELREIEFIFKNGIMGRFGTIYNDISIDTICGSDGWIEKYYSEYRPKRNVEPKKIVDQVSGISKEDFYKIAPEYEIIEKNSKYIEKAKRYSLTLVDVAVFYNINSLDTYEHDMEIFKTDYEKLDEVETTDPITNEKVIRKQLELDAYLIFRFSEIIKNHEGKTTSEIKKWKIANKGKHINQDDVIEFYGLINQSVDSYLMDKKCLIDMYNEVIPCTVGDIKEIKDNYTLENFLRMCFSKLIKSILK